MMFPGSRSIQRLNGPACELAQALVPGDRNLVGPSQPTCGQILLELLVDRREQEIMTDTHLDPGRPGTAR